jgi:trans-aconitate 2-methyltransferase
MRWDPTQYARYADERSRPFFDLVGRIDAERPQTVVDLGCGSGELTITLAERWPEARVRGIDSSPEMIAKAPAHPRTTFEVADAYEFDATGVDVLVSNAMLQWVPDHVPLLTRWTRGLRPGGWLAFQVPSNFSAPSHRLMRELADSPAWRSQLLGVLRHETAVSTPAEYVDHLARHGLTVDAWRTEYQHILQGEDPVLEWVRGTGLRPVLAALSKADATRFSAEYAERLREAYPRHEYGTIFGFARTFVVARKGH